LISCAMEPSARELLEVDQNRASLARLRRDLALDVLISPRAASSARSNMFSPRSRLIHVIARTSFGT
jgi:hypothetical protein